MIDDIKYDLDAMIECILRMVLLVSLSCSLIVLMRAQWNVVG
ncbi:hypothetical protein APHNP_0364 [Anaplasma phagocytophilum str. ApNP]|uniref:Uncharacterized protein n=1 Tax=Anaplasma phagocytophilum str. ApNP TaxID=1359153 RepID=A0A0F3NFU3_ANAPH|nr:hypothetical protein APHNP_0364 [Anaplasma phagocytophilum str. ApNP]